MTVHDDVSLSYLPSWSDDWLRLWQGEHTWRWLYMMIFQCLICHNDQMMLTDWGCGREGILSVQRRKQVSSSRLCRAASRGRWMIRSLTYTHYDLFRRPFSVNCFKFWFQWWWWMSVQKHFQGKESPTMFVSGFYNYIYHSIKVYNWYSNLQVRT